MRWVVGLLLCLPGLTFAGDFNNLVHEFSRQTGLEQTHIPFLGVARFVVATARPKGTSEFRMALFENVNGRQRNFIETADRVVSGDGWRRMIRTRSSRGEWNCIYMRPEGKSLRMLVTKVDDGDAVFVEMRIKPEMLMEFVDEHDGAGR